MSEKNTIGKDYSTGQLIKLVAAPVITEFFLSLLQTLDDGLFISRFIGSNALAAFSIGLPLFMAINAISELFCSVSVICATKMGENKKDEASSSFTSIAIMMMLFGTLVSLIIGLNLKAIVSFLGASDVLAPYIIDYLKIGVLYMPLTMLALLFSRFYIPAGKPSYAVMIMIISSLCNFFFDWIFIVKMNIGIQGAAYANMISNIIVVSIGIVFYSSSKCEIGFKKPNGNYFKLLMNCFRLGLPSFLTSVSLSVNSYIANQVLLRIGGEEIVSSYTIINNIQFMFASSLLGLSNVLSPLISYAYGENNRNRIKKILKQTIELTSLTTIIVIVSYLIGKDFMMNLYLKNDVSESIRTMTSFGLKVAPLGFIFFGYNVMCIASFTALNDSKRATILTVLKNIVFANLSMIVLPILFNKNGVWFVFAVCEALTFIFTLILGVSKKQSLNLEE